MSLQGVTILFGAKQVLPTGCATRLEQASSERQGSTWRNEKKKTSN